MYQEFQGIGQKYLINIALITYVVEKSNVRMIMTAFDEIEVLDTLEEIKDKINNYYKIQSIAMFN